MKNIVFNNREDIKLAVFKLPIKEPKFLKAVSVCGLPKIRVTNTGIKALLKIILGQQISVAAVNSISQNLLDNNLTNIKSVSAADEVTTGSLGMSKTKIVYGNGLALAGINYDLFMDESDSDSQRVAFSVRNWVMDCSDLSYV